MPKLAFSLICGIFCAMWPVRATVPLLIFPPTAPTRTQWIAGIGIPLQDLKFESMVTGYVLKAEYFLPDNVTQLKTKTVTPFVSRHYGKHLRLDKFLQPSGNVSQTGMKRFGTSDKKQIVLSGYRWSVYKALEGLASRMGLPGRQCMLKSICEASETPFHYYNGLVAELMYILLTPSASADELSAGADHDYYQAEQLGRSGVSCHQFFKDCPRSLLDHFSDIQHFSQGLFKASILG